MELDKKVEELVENHPSTGEIMLNGHLRAKKIFIQRKRLRESLHRVNPEECASRKLHTIERRQYSCPCPNYVWHVDGTHKLVRWRFIVHAGIDGFSRLVVYCHCSTNNKAATVLDLFQRAVSDYGLPLRIRSDYGVENVRVWDYMIQRQQNTNTIILGSSVHNQRIERFNRDVNYQVVNHFFNQFMHLEDIDMLDPMNENDLFCLHLTYLPEINKRLFEFRHAYNDHAISSERNFFPRQLFYYEFKNTVCNN